MSDPPTFRRSAISRRGGAIGPLAHFAALLCVAIANSPAADAPLATLSLQDHPHAITKVAFSADGKWLASAALDHTVKVRDTAIGKATLTFNVGDTAIGKATPTKNMHDANSVAFSPDGKRLAAGSNDGTIRLWETTSGQKLLTLKAHTLSVWSLAFSPDGKRLASAGYDQKLRVWDTTSGRETLLLKGRNNTLTISVTFSPDGKWLAAGDVNAAVKLWNTTSGQPTLTLKGSPMMIWNIAYSLDGKRLAAATGTMPGMPGPPSPGQVKVWDVTSGQETLTLRGHADTVAWVAFSPDGKQLATGCHDGTVKVWDATSGRETRTLKGHTVQVLTVAFSPDGTRLFSASSDKTVKVWDMTP